MREALRDIQPAVTIQVAMDGDEALARLHQQGKYADAPAPDLIFLDFNLPKSNSRDVLRQVKLHPELRLIPVAVLTTSDAERDIRDAYELHANCYLRKPIDLDGFFSTIRKAAHFWLDVAHSASNVQVSR